MSTLTRPRTEAQRAAARANGAKSQGPVTAEGKTTSSRNALRHGLTASSLLLSAEDRPEFDAFLAAYVEALQPRGPIQEDLVEEIAVAKWLQHRCWRFSATLIDNSAHRRRKYNEEYCQARTPFEHAALAFDDGVRNAGTFALLDRYAARHAREYHRALDKLEKLQQMRGCQEAEEEISPNEPEPEQPKSNQQPGIVIPIRPDPSPASTGPAEASPATPPHREPSDPDAAPGGESS